MEKIVQKIENLLKKRNKKQRELAKTNAEITKLQESRQRAYERLANSDEHEVQDRELNAIKRSLPPLREKVEDLTDALTAFSKAIVNMGENVQAELSKALEGKYDEAKSEYDKNNQAHLKKLREANEFGREKVTPAHRRKDKLHGVLLNFRSSKQSWTPEKLIQAVQNPEMFLESPVLGELLGFQGTLDKIRSKQTEDEKKARAQKQKQREENTEERECRAQAKMILAERKPMPKHIAPYVTDDLSPELLVKLLLTVEPKPEENEKSEEAVNV